MYENVSCSWFECPRCKLDLKLAKVPALLRLKGISFQSLFAAAVKDLSPKVFTSLALGCLRNLPTFDGRLYLHISLKLINLLKYAVPRHELP